MRLNEAANAAAEARSAREPAATLVFGLYLMTKKLWRILLRAVSIACELVHSESNFYGSEEFREFMNRRGFDMIYLDSAKYAEFMKADNEDNGAALKSLGLAK